ncbi:MAG: aspartate kinase [Chloroflexi bacterium]|nr:aspartate kinase [Chloroflexota bacterium]MCL5110317.1 aspartate kinase [Chloroflexota bacterium]
MALIVHKYGGTSVGSAERIKKVAQRVKSARDKGNRVVVVVSAMGHTTDELIALAKQVTDNPSDRELDMLLSTGEVVSITLLAMALRSLGAEAISLTGGQAGIMTDTAHRRASIIAFEPARIHRELECGKIVIVAGFQGITEDLDITTLGRGGSDTTAVALAAGLKADLCEIYTDVDGVLTADPRLVPGARQLRDISFEEMLELAQQGARVMHPRAVELGAVYNMPIMVRCSFNGRPGTLIHGGELVERKNKVRGIAHDLDVAKITVQGVPDRPGVASRLFTPLAEAGVNVSTIVQNAGVEGLADVSFTVSRQDLSKALGITGPVAHDLGARKVVSGDNVGKVSIVGSGIENVPGHAATMFRALAEHGINIEMITTSQIRITCVVEREQVARAVAALHSTFELDKLD